MTHGPEYKTNGKRPVWLNDGDSWGYKTGFSKWIYGSLPLSSYCWKSIDSIRLPADHWANAAIEAGYEPWAGGDEAPVDWDGFAVMTYDATASPESIYSVREVRTEHPWWRKPPFIHVIGYKKKESVVSELPKDVTALVISARRVWEGLDFSTIASDEGHELDKALEAFSSRVPYEDEPEQSAVSDEVQDWAIVEAYKENMPVWDGKDEYVLDAYKDKNDPYSRLIKSYAHMIQTHETHRKPKERDEEIADKWVEKFFHSEIGVKQTILSAIKEAKS